MENCKDSHLPEMRCIIDAIVAAAGADGGGRGETARQLLVDRRRLGNRYHAEGLWAPTNSKMALINIIAL